MDAKVAVAHYPEGAGHATRMLAVARALEARGAAVTLAGGGPGRQFVEQLGYCEYVPTPVDYVGDYQGGSLANVLANSLPDSLRRVRDYARWLRREGPDALVTDDLFAALAARVTGTPLFSLTHNTPGLYDDRSERAGAWLFTRGLVGGARELFYPAVWPPAPADPSGATRLPPLALDARAEAVETEVLVVPSTYSTTLSEAAADLRDRGHQVTEVGGPDWEPVDSLLPTLRAADRVVCAGYSTVMEAAVAGTPCVVFPHTSEQSGVARLIERGGVAGFTAATSLGELVDAVESSMSAPAFENGADRVADRVLGAL